jgi:hypothetical protein
MTTLKPKARNWKPGQLLITIPYQGIVIRRPRVNLNSRQAAYLQAKKMAAPSTQAETPPNIQSLPLRSSRRMSTPTTEPESENLNTIDTEQVNQLHVDSTPSIRVGGKEVTAEEQRRLTGFFNNPHNRSLALTINNIGNRVMDEIASNRPLTWTTLTSVLSQKQLESAVKWLRSTYLPTL